MVGSASASSLSALNNAIYNVSLTQSSIGILEAQGSSGLISSDYAGLGDDARTVLDLGGQLALNATATANAAQAADVNQVTQTALGQIQTLVSGVTSQLLEPAAQTATGLSALSSSARNTLTQVAGLLDTKVGQIYVFAGQDNRTPPIPDPSNVSQSTFYAAIQAAVADLPTGGAALVQSQLLSVAAPGATSPFSATLEASNEVNSTDLGNGEMVQLGVLADRNTDAVSAGTGITSTGSYMRDVLMALSTIGAMGTVDPTSAPVQTLLSTIHTTLSNADDALNTDIAGLGARQSLITSAQSELTSTASALKTQLGAAEDADPTQVATNLANAQTQLQASYKIISSLSDLSLAKFL